MNQYRELSTGLQHIGIPVSDLERSIGFYEKLGFELALKTENEGVLVTFLKLGDLCLELYQNGQASRRFGAIDHFAINVTDVDKVHDLALADGLNIIEERQLPYRDNGVKYFTILGPDKEKVNFNQYL